MALVIVIVSLLLMPTGTLVHPIIPKDGRLDRYTFRNIHTISANTPDECYIMTHYYMVVPEESDTQKYFYLSMVRTDYGRNLLNASDCALYLRTDDWVCKDAIFGRDCEEVENNFELEFLYSQGDVKVYNINA